MILLATSHEVSLKRELGVKTPFEAIEKWFELKPEMFLQKPLEF